MRNKFPMHYKGATIQSLDGLYGLIRCVGENIRSGTGGNRQAAVQMIEYAKRGGWIHEHQARALCQLLMRHPIWTPSV